MNTNELKRIEDRIGYNFNNLDLLQQAFVRKSYSEENGGENNEVLEFIGDKVLDIIIVKLLTEKFSSFTGDTNPESKWNEFCCSKSEGELTKIKSRLVEKKMLAYCIDSLQLADYLIMSEGDRNNEVYKSASVKEDLFEAILGAVTLDSGWDFNEIANVVDIMLHPDSFLEEPDSENENNYIELIQEWYIKKSGEVPRYHFKPGDYQSTWYIPFDGVSQRLSLQDSVFSSSYIQFHCLLNLGDNLPVFRGFGASKSEARKAVCKVAYEYLEKHHLLFSIQDEIENPNMDEAISQLETLSRRGYFSLPVYDFKQTYDENGNPIWRCICSIEEEQQSFEHQSSAKKGAKKQAAFQMLQYVLDNEEKK